MSGNKTLPEYVLQVWDVLAGIIGGRVFTLNEVEHRRHPHPLGAFGSHSYNVVSCSEAIF